jgi:hypothetical protein
MQAKLIRAAWRPAWRTDGVRFAAWAGLLVAARLALYAALAGRDLPGRMCAWDCHWYVIVADHGYDAVWRLRRGHWQPDWAFFPLLPWLMRGVAGATGLSAEAAGLVVSSLALWVFAVAGAAYRRATRVGARSWPWLLALLAWPFGVYFQAPYTESLFAALVCCCLLAAARGRPWLAAAASALLTATRPNAVLVAAWLALRGLRAAWRGPAALPALLPVALAPLGLVAFMALLWVRLGDPLAFVHAQGAWGHSLRNPAAVLADAVRPAASGGHLGLLYNAAWAALGLAVAAFTLWRGRRVEAWLCGGTVCLALLSGTLWSMPRYVAGNPVVLFAAADLLDRASPRLRYAALACAMAIQLAITLAWFREAPFLV